MMRVNHEHKLISIDRNRSQQRLFRVEGNNSKLRAVLENFGWYTARERSQNSNLDHRVQPPELRQRRQEVEARKLVGRDGELALVHLAQLLQRDVRLASQ